MSLRDDGRFLSLEKVVGGVVADLRDDRAHLFLCVHRR
jgi:hypothetical protein